MSDVRAAAERMRAWLELPEPKGVTDRHYPGGVEIDSEILVNSYLAEHPADDGDGLTLQWWAENIACSMGERFRRIDGPFFLYLEIGNVVFLESERQENHSLPMLHIKTRGDVRRLCRSLGVEVKG